MESHIHLNLNPLNKEEVRAAHTMLGALLGDTVASTAPVAEEAKEEKKTTRKRADAPAPAAAEAAAPAAAKITRDEALAFLKTVAEAKSIGGKDLIAFLQKEFGVQKFSDIDASRYGELKTMAESVAVAPEKDPMA